MDNCGYYSPTPTTRDGKTTMVAPQTPIRFLSCKNQQKEGSGVPDIENRITEFVHNITKVIFFSQSGISFAE
jgi:hypothetical protein